MRVTRAWASSAIDSLAFTDEPPTVASAIGERWSSIALMTGARRGWSPGQGPDLRSERGRGARWARRALQADGRRPSPSVAAPRSAALTRAGGRGTSPRQ